MASRSRYRVDFANHARDDLVELAAYLTRRDSTQAAASVVARLRRRTLSLRTSPLRGRIVPELIQLGVHSWRELVVSPYGIIYRVDGREVFVVAVVDRRRDLRELLQDRLVRPLM